MIYNLTSQQRIANSILEQQYNYMIKERNGIMKNRKLFTSELTKLINKCCIENESCTPDYILANFLVECLDTFARVMQSRDNFHDLKRKPVENNLK